MLFGHMVGGSRLLSSRRAIQLRCGDSAKCKASGYRRLGTVRNVFSLIAERLGFVELNPDAPNPHEFNIAIFTRLLHLVPNASTVT